MRGPWKGAQLTETSSAPSAICSGAKLSSASARDDSSAVAIAIERKTRFMRREHPPPSPFEARPAEEAGLAPQGDGPRGLATRANIARVRACISVRQQREGPHRAALRDLVLELLARRVPPQSADPRKDRHVLPAVVGVGDRLRVDAGPGLELPQLFAVLEVERKKLAGLLAGEQQPAAGGERR